MYASVGKIGIIRQDTATSQAFYNMVFEDDALRDYIFTRLEKACADSEWEPYISTGTQRNLNADKVKSFRLLVPSANEIAKIGSFFKEIDSLITLHQRKYDGCAYPPIPFEKGAHHAGNHHPGIIVLRLLRPVGENV